nr:hypothetical protein [Xanthomonas campestris]
MEKIVSGFTPSTFINRRTSSASPCSAAKASAKALGSVKLRSGA